MITAVDTSVLIDLFGADQEFGLASKEALKKAAREGQIVACDVVWAETAAVFDSIEGFEKAMTLVGVLFSPLKQQTSIEAATAWRKYRRQGGKRERVAADFLIGAHAKTENIRLLTRDRGFYRTYFTQLRIWDPTAD